MILVGYDGSPPAERALNAAVNLLHDPLRMACSLLAGKAVAAIVNAVDHEHREVVTTTAPAGGPGYSALMLAHVGVQVDRRRGDLLVGRATRR